MRNWHQRGISPFPRDLLGIPQIITATVNPALAVLTSLDDPIDGYSAGTFASTAGNITTAVVAWNVDENANQTSGTAVSFTVTVSDDAGTTPRVFGPYARTVVDVTVTATTAAFLDPATADDTPADVFNAGIYSADNGATVNPRTVSYTKDAFVGTILGTATLAENDVLDARETAPFTTALGNSGSAVFDMDAVTVTAGALASPTFSVQPTISTGVIGDTLTITEGTAGPSTTLTIEEFTLATVDKTSELVGLTWDTTGESAGQIRFRVRATNATGFVLSNVITYDLVAAGSATLTPATSVTYDGATLEFYETDTTTPKSLDTYVQADGRPAILTGGIDYHFKFATPSSVVSGTFSDGSAYTGRTINGAMLNPGNIVHSPTGTRAGNYYGGNQGFDSLWTDGSTLAFNAGKDVSAGITIASGTLVQAVSELSPPANLRGLVERYAIFTVIDYTPSTDGDLRPGQSATTPAFVGNKSTVEAYVDTITTRAAPASWTRSIADLITNLQISEPVHYTLGDKGRNAFPTARTLFPGSGYGRDYAMTVGECFAALQYSSNTLADRKTLAIAMVQAGIDLNERTDGQGGEYNVNGGLNNGRWGLAAFAATVLNDINMKANVAGTGSTSGVANVYRWHELGHALRVTSAFKDFRTGFSNEAVVDGGTGYAVDDIVTMPGGVAIDDVTLQFRVTSVSSGVVTSVSIERQGYYYTLPSGGFQPATPTAVTGGSGTGLTVWCRASMLYHDGMVGDVEWNVNYFETRTPDLPTAALEASYRHINYKANISEAITARGLPGFITTADAGDWFDLADRAYHADGIATEVYVDWALEEWASQRGFTGAAPAVVSSELIGDKLWVRFDRPLQEKNRPVSSDFTVKVGGVAQSLKTDGFMVWASSIYFVLVTPAVEGDAVTLDYTIGTTPAVLRDYAGNETASFTGLAVTNSTPTLAPINSAAPVNSGSTVEGATLTSTTGTWSGTGTITYAYQWKRGATNVGINSATYTTGAGDVGANMTCTVTATDDNGSASAVSNSVGPITTAGIPGNLFTAGEFSDPSVWTGSVGGSIAGGKLNYDGTNVANSTVVINSGEYCPVSENTTYNFSMDVDSYVVAGKRFRVRITYKDGNDIGAVSIGAEVRLVASTFTPVVSASLQQFTDTITTPAGTTFIYIVIQCIDAGMEAVVDNLTFIAA
tara:strand:- start:2121 stop:5660 length:3540 start_codon:yes stop_codon:yes gene_type:complete